MNEESDRPLIERSCKACRGDMPALRGEDLSEWSRKTSEWEVVKEHHLQRRWSFANFLEALDFVNRIAEVAEEQGHHPDISFSWGWVNVCIWTHKIDALTESDFILAAHIDHCAHGEGGE
ncbi:4a-hydroxytetrahydrobiopterin dehydratase [bacterium TMED181]|nr:4a-hydroxytetrahydrobiopterin dehydratase [Planctomycetota bacterium]OUW43667.1 MAG: 4a-hydroxytetrahydrobiopterin dehydratase [bacterium TMED181]